MLYDLFLVVAPEIECPEILRIESDGLRDRSRETALIQRHAREHSNIHALRGGKQVLLRALIEDAVDYLHRVYQAGIDDLQRGIRIVIVDGNTDSAHLPGFLEVLESPPPLVPVDPLGTPDVELLQVDRLQAEVAQALISALENVVVGKYLFDADAAARWPLLVLRRHFGGYEDLLLRVAHYAADQLLTMPIAICKRRVDEIEPQ